MTRNYLKLISNIYYIDGKEMINIAKALRLLNRKIANIAGVKLSINILFPDDRQSINLYSGSDKEHLSLYIDYPVYLSVDLPKMNLSYAMDPKMRRFNISPYNKEILVESMYDFIDIFKNDDIFYLEGGQLHMFAPIKDEYKRRVRLNDTWLMFMPCIVTDQDGNQYEGVEITLNKDGNNCLITYAEFKGLTKLIDRADIFMYSQLLLNFIGKQTVFRTEEEQKKRSAEIDERFGKLDFSTREPTDEQRRMQQNRLVEEKRKQLERRCKDKGNQELFKTITEEGEDKNV
jgi:hypothetical protein